MTDRVTLIPVGELAEELRMNLAGAQEHQVELWAGTPVPDSGALPQLVARCVTPGCTAGLDGAWWATGTDPVLLREQAHGHGQVLGTEQFVAQRLAAVAANAGHPAADVQALSLALRSEPTPAAVLALLKAHGWVLRWEPAS